MNIIIPMGGLGTRFASDGYRFPKPLVKILGRPMVFWLLDRLVVTPADTVFVAVLEDVEKSFGIVSSIQQEFSKKLTVKPVFLKFETGGAAETLFVVLQTLTAAERARRTISLDCDTFYFTDILTTFRSIPDGESATFYFQDDGDVPVYSYIRLDERRSTTSINRDKTGDSDRVDAEAAPGQAPSAVTAPGLTLPAGTAEAPSFSVPAPAATAEAPTQTPSFSAAAPTQPPSFSAAAPTQPPSFSASAPAQTLSERAAHYVTDIREKVAISRHANTGAYAFASAELLHRYCAEVLDNAVGAAGEYYTSSVLLRMVQRGEPVRGLFVDDFACVGTPRQLRDFMQRLGREPRLIRKQRFCFDLDNTLVTYPTVPGDYATVQPIARNIQLVRQLKELGHTIIIYTARRMKTHGGNMGRLIKDVALVTLAKLDEFDVPYDEIYFGKPYADVYVDDLAVNALVDTNKELGWLDAAAVPSSAAAAAPPTRGMMTPRDFNSVQVLDELVIKTIHDPERAAGERYFYEHVPARLAHYFPAVRGIETSPATGACVLRLERIRAPTASHLLVSRCITPARLDLILRALHDLHSESPPTPAEQTPAQGSAADPTPAFVRAPGSAADPTSAFVRASNSIYANYLPKVRARYQKHAQLYREVGDGDDVEAVYAAIVAALEEYEAGQHGVPVAVVHGDPVLSNVLLGRDASVHLIDMRGSLDGHPTLAGDAAYDFAKVLQSLCGYDYILHDMPMADDDRALLQTLRTLFFARVREWLGPTFAQPRRLLMLTASLVFSLIPLHIDGGHRVQFFKLCKQIISAAGSADGAL